MSLKAVDPGFKNSLYKIQLYHHYCSTAKTAFQTAGTELEKVVATAIQKQTSLISRFNLRHHIHATTFSTAQQRLFI